MDIDGGDTDNQLEAVEYVVDLYECYKLAEVESARKAAKVAAIGSAVVALHLGGTSWRYLKSPHGTLL